MQNTYMLIKLKDYERIHQIITAILVSENEKPAYSCIKYSLIGAHILRAHFKKDAYVKCGMAVFRLGNEEVTVFGEQENNRIYASEVNFHCWIEAEGWYIDFMAPRFGDLTESKFIEGPKMFQKKMSAMKKNFNNMDEVKQFYFSHNQELSDTILIAYCKEPSIRNWAKYCSEWFKKVPKKVIKSQRIFNEAGDIRHIEIKPINIRSNW